MTKSLLAAAVATVLASGCTVLLPTGTAIATAGASKPTSDHAVKAAFGVGIAVDVVGMIALAVIASEEANSGD